MSVKPILFNTDMVRAIQNDIKTVTRRVVKPQPTQKEENPHQVCKNISVGTSFFFDEEGGGGIGPYQLPYKTGDVLYVRETFFEYKGKYYYKADGKHLALNSLIGGKEFFKWRPSIHMPKKAARIFLRVTDVRVERLQDITEEEARAEGFGSRAEFIKAFLAMYPDCTEESWVWVIEFERVDKPEGWPRTA